MAGLNHPESIEMWEAWSRSRRRPQRLKHAVTERARGLRRRPGSPEAEQPRVPEELPWVLRSRAADPSDVAGDGADGGTDPGSTDRRILVAADSSTPTSRASLLSGLLYHRAGIDVLTPAGVHLPETEGPEWETRALRSPEEAVGPATGAIVSIGQHLRAGAAAHELARRHDLPEFVVQHGALTPFAPPLPEGATLLAWSDADAEFWRSGRSDVTTRTVGSQLLWQSAHEAEAQPQDVDAVMDAQRPVFLGQLHGAELSRRVTGGAAVRFCREHDGLYRPHPAEVDMISRAQHRLWQRRGMEFASTDVPLRELAHPVVSVFSTGVLEAAARGSRAWVYAPGAPGWVHELWERYDMRRFGGEPTPSPVRDAEEPASRIVQVLEEAL
ncbi:hypothetical protein NLU66_04335 [Brachybacterium sp. NBEC-018]|uniref:hypothetical protein n=1 Tax=Brachybacterium sp. NBEC-018 TaxID=2996004 RepID=UPI002174EE03|nr:hypothetical protein [Brachybacterium sp. NBEC-018]UVY84831.1 hypothetical protein NLU66_04335 [Brachybacterium sp. NBEC-018]